jgi:hypothetical protein
MAVHCGNGFNAHFDPLPSVEELLPFEIECTARTLAALNANEKKLLYELLGRLADS